MALTNGLTEYQIVCRAAALIGTQVPSSAEYSAGSTPVAARLAQLFESSAKIVLRAHDWACATKVKDYNAGDGATGSLGYDYALTLPDDYVKVIRLYDSAGVYLPGDRWKIINGVLHTGAEDIFMEYIALPTDYSELDILVADCIATNLAAVLAFAIKQDDGLYGALMKTYLEYTLPNAKAQDTLEDKHAFTENDRTMDARLSVGGVTW